ncbi:MAG: biotin--[acetyl-CoA-carboxylase] ligase [Candidatus Dormibacteria bacterium]|jgi:BirA family biotin operon repressor/biotin-[acetyl-CoA-carboxylase] ligase
MSPTPGAGSEAALRRAGEAVFPGFQLRRLARTPSTQDVVREAARSGAREGFCCVAEEQTAGRGRSGRRWLAPPGTALLMSILLRRPAQVAAGVPLLAGLAVADAITGLTGVACRLKWPNDVLAGPGKLAGILAEVETGGGIVLGLGVNLTVPGFPPGVPGVSLDRLAGAACGGDALLTALLPELGRRLRQVEAGGIRSLRADWTERAAGLGGPVRAQLGTSRVEGTALGIDDDGALLVETRRGRVRLVAGEVHLLPAQDG